MVLIHCIFCNLCLPVIVSTIFTSLVIAYVMMKLLKMDSKVSCLIGVGSSICGGSAIAATAPIIAAVITTAVSAVPDTAFSAFYLGSFVKAAKWLAKFFIAMAMCAIGLNTNIVE